MIGSLNCSHLQAAAQEKLRPQMQYQLQQLSWWLDWIIKALCFDDQMLFSIALIVKNLSQRNQKLQDLGFFDLHWKESKRFLWCRWGGSSRKICSPATIEGDLRNPLREQPAFAWVKMEINLNWRPGGFTSKDTNAHCGHYPKISRSSTGEALFSFSFPRRIWQFSIFMGHMPSEKKKNSFPGWPQGRSFRGCRKILQRLDMRNSTQKPWSRRSLMWDFPSSRWWECTQKPSPWTKDDALFALSLMTSQLFPPRLSLSALQGGRPFKIVERAGSQVCICIFPMHLENHGGVAITLPFFIDEAYVAVLIAMRHWAPADQS